jgi:hypothetical protein
MSPMHKPRLEEDSEDPLRQEIEEEYYRVRQMHIDAKARVIETHYLELEAHKKYLRKLWENKL